MVTILEFIGSIIIWFIETLEKLGIPDVLTLFIFIALLIAAIVFLTRKKFNKLFKASLIIFCSLILFFTVFTKLILIDGYRIKRGAESFIQKAISTLNNGKLPPVSSNANEDEKLQIKTSENNLPKENYEIEFSDRFGDLWEFYVHFENGKSFFCAVDAPNTFMRLFVKTKYQLYSFRETEKIQKED